jgi:hypothetical protein
VSTALEFSNAESAQLGIPLPAGTIRVYRKDGEQLEFVGEDKIEHTPRNERVRLSLGNAFDLVGERKRTAFDVNQAARTMDESFEIRLRNRGEVPVEIRAVEHLVRSASWTVSTKTMDFKPVDSHTIEFPAAVPAEGEITIRYAVRYTW